MVEPAETRRGFAGRLLGVWLDPGAEFRAIAASATFWAPLVAWTLLSILFTGLWLYKVDVLEYVRAQADLAGRPMAPAAQTAAAARVLQVSWLFGACVGPALTSFIVAGALFVAFRAVRRPISFGPALTVSTYALLGVTVVSLLATVLALAIQNDWNQPVETALKSNLGALLDRQALPPWIYVLAGSLDVFTIWTVVLLAHGCRWASGATFAESLKVTAALWVLYVAAKVGAAALLH